MPSTPTAETETTTPTPQSTEDKGESLLDPKEKPDAKTEEKKPESKDGPPEKYDFKAPDGYELVPEVIEKASAIFKDLGLSNEQAQRLVDLQADISKQAAEAPYTAFDEMVKGWKNEVTAKYSESAIKSMQVNISKALDSVGNPDLVKGFKSIMNMTGAGNNLAFIEVFNHLAQAFTEGSHVVGKGPSEHGQTSSGTVAKPSPARALYPNNPSAG